LGESGQLQAIAVSSGPWTRKRAAVATAGQNYDFGGGATGADGLPVNHFHE